MESTGRNVVSGGKSIPAKNKTPAPVQITAEQLLREAKERQLEYVAPVKYRNCCFEILSTLSLLRNKLIYLIFCNKIKAPETKNLRPRRTQRHAFKKT